MGDTETGKFDTFILACSDGRTTAAVELLRELGNYGKIETIRNPGGLLNESVIREIGKSGAGLVIILDHTDCAAHKHILDGIKNGHKEGLTAKMKRVLEERGISTDDIGGEADLAGRLQQLHVLYLREKGFKVLTATIHVTGLSVDAEKVLVISDQQERSSAQIIEEAGLDAATIASGKLAPYIIKANDIKKGYVKLMRNVLKNKITGAPAREFWLVQKGPNLKIRGELTSVNADGSVAAALRTSSGAAAGKGSRLTTT